MRLDHHPQTGPSSGEADGRAIPGFSEPFCPSPSPIFVNMVGKTETPQLRGVTDKFTGAQHFTVYLTPFSPVQPVSRVRLFVTVWNAACQASPSFTISQSLLKLMTIYSVMPSNHLILCRPLLLLPSIFPGIRVFSKESVLCIRWPKYWSFSFSISPFNESSELISFRIDWCDLLAVQGTLKSLL